MPRLNELHPYSFISHYQVWINYVCGVSDDNEMMMITLTIISISGPRVISNTNSCPTSLFWAEQSTKKVRHRVNLSKLGKYVRAHQNIFMQFWTYKEDSFLPYLLKASKHLTILGEVWGALSYPGTCVWLNTRSPQLVQLKWIRGNLQRLFPVCEWVRDGYN